MTNKQTSLELLSPARDLECGLAAINHGADAVYIGAPKFGARAAAGNPLEDITLLQKAECILAVMKDGIFYKNTLGPAKANFSTEVRQ